MERAKGRDAPAAGEGEGLEGEGGREEEEVGNESATDRQTSSGRCTTGSRSTTARTEIATTAVSTAQPRLFPAPSHQPPPERALPQPLLRRSTTFPRARFSASFRGTRRPGENASTGHAGSIGVFCSFFPPPRRSRKRPEQSSPAAPPCFSPATGFGRSPSQAGKKRRRDSC